MDPPPSMKYLLWYLENSAEEPRYKSTCNVDICRFLPWNRDTILCVLSYVFQLISNLEHCNFTDTIIALDESARSVHDAKTRAENEIKTDYYVDPLDREEIDTRETDTKQVEFSEMLVNSSFLDVVARFFAVPKLHQLRQSHQHLYQNEILAGFMDFILQVLYHQTNISTEDVQRWALVRQELSFLLAVLGDIPFQCTHHVLVEQITSLLEEFEMLANEAGSWVYDSVFPNHRMEPDKFHEKTVAWFEMVELLTPKIKEHCFKFSELPTSLTSRSRVVDSFFIVNSLIEDIENLKNHALNFNRDDAIAEQLETLHGELTVSQSFIKVLQDNEEKEGLIEIRDLTYEAEYLINSLVGGNIHVWYLNLRIPSIIHKIKLALTGLQQISETKVNINCDVKPSCSTTGNTGTMDENHFLDFNFDITQRILKDQGYYIKMFEFSYKQLPRNIKPCFLYFAAFPKDFEISEEKLRWLWIGEGFIQKEGNKSLEETAEMYLSDLINRKLLVITKRTLNGTIKRCKIHSLLHEFCSRKAQEENFIKFTNEFCMYEKCQRLCVPSPRSYNYSRPFGLHCRSYRDLREQQNSQCFQTMALLKVVDQLPKEDFCDSPHPALAFPAQLRYLGVSHLSSKMVANLVNLEVIYVTQKYNRKVYIPSVVLKMVKLRHLVREGVLMFQEDCSNMTETNNLRTLSAVCVNDKKEEDMLRCSPYLRTLECVFTDETKFPDLSFLAELESLKMQFYFFFTPEVSSLKISFPSTINKLILLWSKLPWEMMSVLGKLPNLLVLELGNDAFTGDIWKTRDDEFQKLRCLKVESCSSLGLWISCSKHFPALECLVLRHCEKLVEIPSDFRNIATLQKIKVKYCTKGACLSALQFGKRIQVDIAHERQGTEELILEFTNATFDDLKNMWSCMEEYFEAGGSEGFINKLLITEDKTTCSSVLSNVLRNKKSCFMQLPVTEEYTTGSEDDGDDEPHIFVNRNAYFVVVSYAMQFSSYSVNLAIMGLRCIANSYSRRKAYLLGHPLYSDEIKKSRREFSDMLVKSFLPQVQIFFEVPKQQQLPDKHLKKNEILASFVDFLLHILYYEVNTDSAEGEQYALLRKELSFILVILGDVPLQPNTHPLDKQVNDLMLEFETFANEVGGFLFSCIFPFKPMKLSRFRAELTALLEMAMLMHAKIREYCSNFSELPVSVIARSNVVDSFFIVDSLVEDLQSIIKTGQLGSFTLVDPVKEQMKTIRDELTLSQRFIKVLWYSESGEEKKCLIQIRDLTYEVEYLIYSLVAGNIPVWYLNLRLPSIIHKIKLARTGLQQLSKTKVVIKACDGKVSFPTTENTSTNDDSQFMDFNHDVTKRILTDLTGNLNTSQQVISIFGMPGLGKTTIANKLYNSCSSYFDRRAWCVVSQNHSVRNLMIKILMCVMSTVDKNNMLKKDVAELGVEIHKTLFGRRYLIVLDDVWHSDVLDSLKIYFPDDRNGSRVLITTRNEDVSPTGSIIHKLPFLSEDQCWNLLEEKVFHKDPCPSHLVVIGKRIAARCSGVPLAVVSIAGVLLNLEKVEREWKKVEEGLDEILLDDKSDYRKIMELSYEHLPHYIKPCFLYFASFREDAEISTKELTWYWIAQGFIPKDGSNSQEEIAETYLSDLINRSLVMTVQRRSVGGLKTCKIHDLLHDICIKKADQENFLNSTNIFSTYEKHQHLHLPSSLNTYWRPFSHYCRSFRGHAKQPSDIQSMGLLKVVELLQKKRFEPIRVDLPLQLRYLGITLRNELIPKGMFDNLVKLEILHVRFNNYKVIVIPSVVLGMETLRHLFVRWEAVFEEDCSEYISETTNLRSISRLVINKQTDVEILRKSPHLQTLKCSIQDGMKFPDLSSHAELESLSMEFWNSIGDVEIRFPLTIKRLCLCRGYLAWEKMSIIGELPKLEVLKLEDNAFSGDEWETKWDQFKELRILKIKNSHLKEWITESSHFPSLEQLVLYRCWGLQEIPSDLGSLPTLQRIEVNDCSKEACFSAIQIEQEQLEYDNQLQVDIFHNRRTKEELMREYTESMREDTDSE